MFIGDWTLAPARVSTIGDIFNENAPIIWTKNWYNEKGAFIMRTTPEEKLKYVRLYLLF